MASILELIDKKQRRMEFSEEEIRFFVDGVTNGTIPDYQISALLMAIWFNGMTGKETMWLARDMAGSGDVVDLSAVPGIKVDKHSTGGIGDKTSLVVVPMLAACGLKVAKMSGRALGFTGGTVDKLEAIPGMRTALGKEEFFRVIIQCGASMISQTGTVCPADKALYQLRDVTGTVSSLPLIAASIMSKKLAAGADIILLDVKTGSGAFMKTPEDSVALARAMVEIGEMAGKKTVGMVTDMNAPLGYAIGNTLEVVEAIDTLRGKGPEDLTALCVELVAEMVLLAFDVTEKEAAARAEEALLSGAAFDAFVCMVKMQGGDVSFLYHPEKFEKAPVAEEYRAKCAGYLQLQAEMCGWAAVALGAGRQEKNGQIDPRAGIVLQKKAGDAVRKGDVIAVLYTSDADRLLAAREKMDLAVSCCEKPAAKNRLIYGIVSAQGTQER